MSLADTLRAPAEPRAAWFFQRLLRVCAAPTGLTSAGYPYLSQESWECLRDTVPQLFGMGQEVLDAAEAIEEALDSSSAGEDEAMHCRRALQVVRQVVHTAAITAPPDLWLLRNVLGIHAGLGLLERLLLGEALYPAHCAVEGSSLDAGELETDLRFLHARGIVEQYEASYRIAGHPRVRALLSTVQPLPEGIPVSATRVWRRLFHGDALDADERRLLDRLGDEPPRRDELLQSHWVPTLEEVETGFRLLPVVLGLRSASLTEGLAPGSELTAATWSRRHPDQAACAARILEAAGWLAAHGGHHRVTALGARGFARGPGPFGIIETYHPYLSRGKELLLQGSAGIWVRRGENIAASQDANHASFVQANDALDRFCEKEGFRYSVFIEHACGRSEASRIRYERSGEEGIRYFGADLEDAAIDAALEEQRRGRLPRNMVFVRRADIGKPEVLLEALRKEGVDSSGAVMMVGNGFHEVRDQTDELMVEVLSDYERAGILLLFTEENALSVEDLRATAWNTYHAGFRYVHEISGQGLRPAMPRSARRAGHQLRTAWFECACQAGYVHADAYAHRSRTIYPYTPEDGHNPSISTNHFFVPGRIAKQLGLRQGDIGLDAPRARREA